MPGVYFLQLKCFTLIFKKKKKTLKTHAKKKKNRLGGKKVWPYHRIFTVLYKCLQMQKECISSVSPRSLINAAFKSDIVQVKRCLWLSVAQLKLTHLMHKTIKYKFVLLRTQTILKQITEHNVREKRPFIQLHMYCWYRRYQGRNEPTLPCFSFGFPS